MFRTTSILFVASLGFISTVAAAQDGPQLVRAPVDRAFVPLGFDDNDNSEVVIYGHFHNTCYKTGPVTATIDDANQQINIDAKAYLYTGGSCGQIVFPFTQSVKLGTVKVGTYKINIVETPQADTSTPLVVVKATSPNPDDYLYATADAADVVKDANGNDMLRLEGTWPYTLIGCMRMKQVMVKQTPGNVVVVQPVAELKTSDADCTDQLQTHKYSIDTPLAQNLSVGDYLLHVRVLNGNSINRVESIMSQLDVLATR